MNMSDVTVGIKTFKRDGKLFNLLNSLDRWNFKKVVVADDSEISEEKWGRYEQMKEELSLEVIDLPYDVGVGTGRKVLFDNTNTDYLLVLDDDIIPYRISALKEILKENDELGMVAPCLIQDSTIKNYAHNFYEEKGYLVEDIRDGINLNFCNNIPYYIFDMVIDPGLYRINCLEDYCIDENYQVGFKHKDFFYHHYKKTDWKFATTPMSFLGHFPGGSEDYIKHRKNRKTIGESKKYFLNKWNLKGILEYRSNFIAEPSLRKSIEISLKRNLPFVGVRFLQALKDQARKFKYV